MEENEKVIIAEVEALLKERKLHFPTPPAVLTKLNSVLASPTASIADVVRVIQAHPVLSAKILQVANSAALSRGRVILSLNDAVTRLGSTVIRTLAQSISLHEHFQKGDRIVSQAVTELWTHSFAIGSLSFVLATYLNEKGWGKVDPSVSLLVGVIHCLGQLPLIDYAVTRGYKIKEVLTLSPEAKRSLTYLVLSRWDLPLPILGAICHEGDYGAILRYVHEYDEGIDPYQGNIQLSREQFAAYLKEHHEILDNLRSMFS